jgi:hypothetical protein
MKDRPASSADAVPAPVVPECTTVDCTMIAEHLLAFRALGLMNMLVVMLVSGRGEQHILFRYQQVSPSFVFLLHLTIFVW